MTHDEFNSWLKFHCSSFPGVIEFFDRSVNGSNGQISQQSIRDAWYAALRDINEVDARAASEQMLAFENLNPDSYARHPARVRKLALGTKYERVDQEKRERKSDPKKQRTKWVDGEPIFSCLICYDKGFVLVERSGKGRFEKHKYKYTLRCCCDAGAEDLSPAYQRFPVYDPESEPREDWLSCEMEWAQGYQQRAF